jgi:putative Ca2+/H+ antiporter (TMEM165/GDT1 family)
VTSTKPFSESNLPSTSTEEKKGTAAKGRSAWAVFGSTFITIFFAEMGDKTQLATLLMSAESQSPWTVFLGAGLALFLTSLLGVWLGCWLSKRVSPKTSETAAAILLFLIAIALVTEVMTHA